MSDYYECSNCGNRIVVADEPKWHAPREHPRDLWVIGEYRDVLTGEAKLAPFYCDELGRWYVARGSHPDIGPLIDHEAPIRWKMMR